MSDLLPAARLSGCPGRSLLSLLARVGQLGFPALVSQGHGAADLQPAVPVASGDMGLPLASGVSPQGKAGKFRPNTHTRSLQTLEMPVTHTLFPFYSFTCTA